MTAHACELTNPGHVFRPSICVLTLVVPLFIGTLQGMNTNMD